MILLAVAGLFGGAVFALLPLRYLVWMTILVTTVISGLILYYGRIEQITWLPYIMAVGLFGRWLVEAALSRGGGASILAHPPSFLVFLGAFFAFLLFTSALNLTNAAQFAVGVKNYLPIWLVGLVIAALPNVERTFLSLEKGAIALSLMQVPFVVQQAYTYRFWDAVVGTYGGNPEGGGASGLLMLFSIVGILATIHMWQTRRLRTGFAAIILGLNVVVIGLAEVKAFFILFPLALLVQQWRNVRKRPLQVLGLMGGALLTIYMLINVYEQLYSSQWTSRAERSAAESLTEEFALFFDPAGVDILTGEVSRGASLAIWWNDAQTSALERVIGYGAGASRAVSTVSIGAAALRHAPLQINSTALAQLLWDAGVVGAILFAGAFVGAIRRALQLARAAGGLIMKSRLQTIAAILSLSVPLLIYDRAIVDMAAAQLLFAVILGLLLRLSQPSFVKSGVAKGSRTASSYRPNLVQLRERNQSGPT